jgi:hypothetical protein
MTRPTAADELFVHQIPELLPRTVAFDPHWRESFFFELHDPEAGPTADAVFFTMAHYPVAERMDSLQMGRIGGQQIIGHLQRPYAGDPHTPAVPGASVEIVRPFEEIRLRSDPAKTSIGLDVTFRARTQAYGLRRGTIQHRGQTIWDQCHILQSGTYHGTYTAGGATRKVDGWLGQRDHSWGVRNHLRCPAWLWFQIQLADGFLGVWHWELSDGSSIYTDGCWAPADRGEPVPVVAFDKGDLRWVDADGKPAAYGTNGAGVAGLLGEVAFALAGGRTIRVAAEGTFARPYEPFHRGGLNLMKVRTDDGRTGTAIYEVTGARHHRWFPDTVVAEPVP